MIPILMAALLAAAPPDDVVGMWHSPIKHGIIQISKCGSSICGYLINADDVRANPDAKDSNNPDASLKVRKLKGLEILSGFSRAADGWQNGQVYSPSKGRTYSGIITIKDANTLSLRGCIFVPLCKTEVWTRVP